MATIERRKSRGQTVYYAKVWRKGQAQSATFSKLSAAKAWAQQVEADVLVGKTFPPKYTIWAWIDRYMVRMLSQKKPSTV